LVGGCGDRPPPARGRYGLRTTSGPVASSRSGRSPLVGSRSGCGAEPRAGLPGQDHRGGDTDSPTSTRTPARSPSRRPHARSGGCGSVRRVDADLPQTAGHYGETRGRSFRWLDTDRVAWSLLILAAKGLPFLLPQPHPACQQRPAPQHLVTDQGQRRYHSDEVGVGALPVHRTVIVLGRWQCSGLGAGRRSRPLASQGGAARLALTPAGQSEPRTAHP
jgi:hypothetical protein